MKKIKISAYDHKLIILYGWDELSATVAACADRACADITDGKTDAIC